MGRLGRCRRQIKNVTKKKIIKIIKIVEFHYYIWIHHEKCFQISTNMPSIGSVNPERDLEFWENNFLYGKPDHRHHRSSLDGMLEAVVTSFLRARLSNMSCVELHLVQGLGPLRCSRDRWWISCHGINGLHSGVQKIVRETGWSTARRQCPANWSLLFFTEIDRG